MNNDKLDFDKFIQNCEDKFSEELKHLFYYKKMFNENFNNSLSAKLIVDKDSLIITKVNKTFLDFSNRKEHDVIGQNIRIITETKKELSIKNILDTVNSGKQYTKIVKYYNNKNKLIYYLVKVSLIHLIDKDSLYITLFDISEQYFTDQKYQNLLDNAPLGILYTDKNGNIDFVNGIMLSMLGSPSAEETKKINMLSSERIKKAGIAAVYKKCIETGKKSQLEMPYTSKWGKKVFVRFYISPIFSDDELTGVLVMAEDITAIKNAEEKELQYKEELVQQAKNLELMVEERTAELNIAKEKAEESDKLKTAFLANMSHEIRTPMNAIIGFTEIINKQNLPNSERAKYVKYINQSGKTLVKLIDDIIDISKIEANQITIKKSNFNLKNLFIEIQAIFKKQLIEKSKPNVDLIINTPEHHEIASSDELRIRQIISNLLNNSIKFTQQGSIEFGYYFDNNNLHIYVKDTGDGIEPTILKNVFDRFVRTKKLNKKGTGIGLSIVKSLTELLDGEVTVESELGVGTQFNVVLKNVETNSELSEIYIDENTYDWTDKTILIAEDDMFNLIILEETLKETNVKIIKAENGIEAVETYKKHKDIIDIVLMDIQMPKLDGFEACKQILEFDKSAKIIAQTAYANKEENDKIVEIGCVDSITKPIENDVFFETIDKYI